jgi:hypothetical protein
MNTFKTSDSSFLRQYIGDRLKEYFTLGGV